MSRRPGARPRPHPAPLAQTLEAIEKSETLADLRQCVTDLKPLLRSNFVALLVQRSVRLVDPETLVVTDYPSDWVALYRNRRYGLIDPTLVRARAGTRPVRWSAIAPETPEQLRMMTEAVEFGLRDGVTFHFRGPSGVSAFMSFAFTRTPHRFDATIRAVTPVMMVIAAALHDAAERFFRVTEQTDGVTVPPDHPLTHRDELCLLWAADGKTTWEIARILGISERTVNGCFEQVLLKLDARNRTHAVAKAIVLGYIRPSLATTLSWIWIHPTD